MTSRLIRRGKGVVDPLSGQEDKGTVLQEGDVVWSVMLNQTDVSYGVKGHNKFYSFQIIIDNKDGHRAYVFFKWGRVGAVNPQRKLHGPFTKDAAKELFVSKFTDKTENDWPLLEPFEPVKGKYTLIDLDYSGDDDDDDGADDGSTADKTSEPAPPSTLPLSVQTFVKMICNVDLIAQEMTELHLDLKRMPLGKLSKQQLAKGYGILDNISDTLHAMAEVEATAKESGTSTAEAAASSVAGGTRRRSSRAKTTTPSAARSQLAKFRTKLKALTSDFYTLIPHNFGMSLPPLIDSVSELKLKLDLLEVLSDIEITHKMLHAQRSSDLNPVDAHYNALGVALDPIDAASPDFSRIQEYIKLTHAPTHRQYTLRVDAVHAIRQDKPTLDATAQGESQSSSFSSLDNHQLLWHGSRLSNIASILTKGLRIAPPEAPSTGFMFGKGVYFADVASKAANYCWASVNQTKGVLILSEVALGTPLKVLEAEDYSFEALQKVNSHSVLGVGRMAPSEESHYISEDGVRVPMGALEPTDAEGTLLYNEYVVYRTDQVKLRYAVTVTFEFK